MDLIREFLSSKASFSHHQVSPNSVCVLSTSLAGDILGSCLPTSVQYLLYRLLEDQLKNSLNPVALRKAKIAYNFCLSESNRVNPKWFKLSLCSRLIFILYEQGSGWYD